MNIENLITSMNIEYLISACRFDHLEEMFDIGEADDLPIYQIRSSETRKCGPDVHPKNMASRMPLPTAS